MLIWLFSILLLLLFGLGGVAFVTLLERKLLGLSQIRLGPNKVSFMGLLQPVADGVKLLWKDFFIVNTSQSILFMISPILLFVFFSVTWVVILPWTGDIFSAKYNSLIYFSLLGLGAYSVVLTGWSSLSKFSKLGSLRGVLQSLSFEVALILVLLAVIKIQNSFMLKMEPFMKSEVLIIWGMVWVLLSLLETNRAPFDLVEGESELISGFNIEMGSVSFVYLFLSEYGMIIVMSAIACFFWFSDINFVLILSVCFILFMRSCFPRVRYDIMTQFMWYSILPTSILLFILNFFL